MATDAVVATPARAPTLTRRASLTAVASLLDYAVKAGVALVITPILVTGLGRTLYGVWEMLGRLVGYMAASDGRASDALRLVMAQQQTAEPDVNRRSVGSALAVWLLMLPIVAAVGGALAWLAPSITHAPDASRNAVRLTCLLLVFSFMLTGVASIPESVLRGMNLGYKRMGLQAGLSIIVGLLAAGAVQEGFGLPGLGATQIARALIMGICFWVLVRKYVDWFGIGKPTRAAVKRLFGMSIWLSVGDLIAKLMLASDVLILGAVISPAAVTTYVLTGYAARTGLGVFGFGAGAAMPGLGGVLGSRDFARAVQIRHELRMLTWLFVTIVGATILVWNPSFLGLWVGSTHYAGPWVDLLIVCLVSQTAFIRADAYIIDAALRPRGRVVIGAISVVATLALGITLTHAFGILGLCVGVLLGRSIQSVSYPLIVRSCLNKPALSLAARLAAVRMALTTALLFAAATLAGRWVDVSSWLVWLPGVALTAGVVAAIALLLGPTPADRDVITRRVRAMIAGLKPKP